jgi:CRP/FNR family transcriptional regulator, cyclic AMP receptor protein
VDTLVELRIESDDCCAPEARDRVQEAFLDTLSEAQAATLSRRGTVRRYARGTALFHEGQSSDRVVIIRSGRVKLCSTSEDGREVVLAVRGPGELIGEMSAIDGEQRSASAFAIDPVEALVVPTGDFKSLLEDSPEVGLAITKMLSHRLRDSDSKRAEFAAQDTMGRIAARLVELAERFGEQSATGSVRIDLPISQEELAGWTGCSREAVAKALQRMRDLGWIETERRCITVLVLDELRQRSL